MCYLEKNLQAISLIFCSLSWNYILGLTININIVLSYSIAFLVSPSNAIKNIGYNCIPKIQLYQIDKLNIYYIFISIFIKYMAEQWFQLRC